MKTEGEEWKDYFKENYREVLKQSITYIATSNQVICGFSRTINDDGLYLWVIDLLVDKSYRGNGIGRKLMESLALDYPDLDAYVMSDVDEYYEKLGYKKEGSIYKVGK